MILFKWCGKTKLSCGLSSGHIKFHKTIAIRSHLQVVTTATFCTCNISFDSNLPFPSLSKRVRSNFICILAHNSKKPKFCWAPSDFSVGVTVSTGTKQTSMQECKTKSLPWVGQLWLSRLTKTSKQCNADTHLLNQCDLINVSCNLPCCCRPRHTNMCFLHQLYLHSFDTDSGLLGKNVYYLQICRKGNDLLCPHQNKNIQTSTSSSAAGGFSA